MFVFHPWEPVDPVRRIPRTPPRTPGVAEQMTRFFWRVGAQAEESVTDVFWVPPNLPALSASNDGPARSPLDQVLDATPDAVTATSTAPAQRDPLDAFLDSLPGRETPSLTVQANNPSAWIYQNQNRLDNSQMLDALVKAGSIREGELAAARHNGYRDWEIIEVIRDGHHPGVLQEFQRHRRQAFNPFHGLIASGVAMALLFCIPVAIGWAIKPLRS